MEQTEEMTFDMWYSSLKKYLKSYRYHYPIMRDTFIEDFDNGSEAWEAADRYLREKGYDV